MALFHHEVTDVQRPQVWGQLWSLGKAEHTYHVKTFTREEIRQPSAGRVAEELRQVLTGGDLIAVDVRVGDCDPLFMRYYLQSHPALQIRLVKTGQNLGWAEN